MNAEHLRDPRAPLRRVSMLMAVILGTVNDAGQDGAVEGHVFAPLCGETTASEFERIVQLLAGAELVKRKGRLMTITDKGRQRAAEIDAEVRKYREQRGLST
jgi:hypothetical protein